MIFSLVRRDLRGRYKGSVLGFLWTFINPLFQLIIYTVVFSTIMKNGIPNYYIYLFVALVPWLFLSASITIGSTCILDQKEMVKKIYFPRQVLPIAYVTSSFINMLLVFIVIFAVIILSGIGINFNALIFLPLVMIIEYILALGIALIVSALTVYFRDLQHILGIITMAWMYLTPVMYSIDMVPEKYRKLFYINPMTPIIAAYRDILYSKQVPQLITLLHAIILGLVVIILGNILFSILQRNFVEEL